MDPKRRRPPKCGIFFIYVCHEAYNKQIHDVKIQFVANVLDIDIRPLIPIFQRVASVKPLNICIDVSKLTLYDKLI